MVVLKKIKSSTLVETITATIILIIVFTIAMFILDNVFKNTVLINESVIRNRIHKLNYQFENDLIEIPYNEKMEKWDLSVDELLQDGYVWIVISAKNESNNKEIIKKISCVGKR